MLDSEGDPRGQSPSRGRDGLTSGCPPVPPSRGRDGLTSGGHPAPPPSRRKASVTILTGGVIQTSIVVLQAVVLIPLYFQYFGARTYGAWLASGDFLIWAQSLDLGLPNLMIQRIASAHSRGDTREVGAWLVTGTIGMSTITVILASLGFAISYLLPSLFSITGHTAELLTTCFQIGVVAASLTLLNNSIVAFSRGIQNPTPLVSIGIAATLCGFLTTLIALLHDVGLMSIPIGMTVRSCLQVAGSIYFLFQYTEPHLKAHLRYNTTIASVICRHLPSTALGGISHTVMNHSDTALIGFLLKPELAAIYSVTRKVADVGKGLLDNIALASYGGFAHLTNSAERHRAMSVYEEIRATHFFLAVPVAAAYIVINELLINAWVGAAHYAGHWLTLLVGLQLVISGRSFLVNYLYRASVSVVRGSLVLALESALRLSLSIPLLLWLGPLGLPLSSICTALTSGWMLAHATRRNFEATPDTAGPSNKAIVIGLLVLGMAAVLCLSPVPRNGHATIASMILLSTCGAAGLFLVDNNLQRLRRWREVVSFQQRH